jgi:hypothetical protein
MAYKTFVNGFPLNASELNNFLMNQSVMVFSSASDRSTNLTAPVEGMITFLQDTNNFESYDGSAWKIVYTTPPSGNAIINGAFDIWQRGTTFSNPGAGNYVADRIRQFSDGSGVTKTISQQTFTPGAAPAAGNEAAYFMRYAVSAAGSGNTYHLIDLPIEDVRTFAGRTVTLSLWAKSAGTSAFYIDLIQEFGSGGSTATSVSAMPASTTSTSWQKFTATFNIPSIAGKTIGTNNYIYLRIVQPFNTTFTLDYWGVQLEAGSVATPFKRNAPSIQAELAACQRYYQAPSLTPAALMIYGGSSSGGFSGNAYSHFVFPVQMRTTPTITFYAHDGSAGQVTLYVASSAIKSTSVASIGAQPWGWTGNFSGTSWGTNADSGLLSYGYKAEAEL